MTKDRDCDPASEGAAIFFDGRMSCSDYLALEKILDAQNPPTRRECNVNLENHLSIAREILDVV